MFRVLGIFIAFCFLLLIAATVLCFYYMPMDEALEFVMVYIWIPFVITFLFCFNGGIK